MNSYHKKAPSPVIATKSPNKVRVQTIIHTRPPSQQTQSLINYPNYTQAQHSKPSKLEPKLSIPLTHAQQIQ